MFLYVMILSARPLQLSNVAHHRFSPPLWPDITVSPYAGIAVLIFRLNWFVVRYQISILIAIDQIFFGCAVLFHTGCVAQFLAAFLPLGSWRCRIALSLRLVRVEITACTIKVKQALSTICVDPEPTAGWIGHPGYSLAQAPMPAVL